MTIEELHHDRIEDWLDFFEKRAFADHDEWKGCYCTAFFYPKPEDYPEVTNKRKDYARWLIETGKMRGYLAYEEGRVVAWVNAHRKSQYPRFGRPHPDHDPILSIVCFLVEKPHRGKGIAKQLLQRIIDDAPAKGFTVIEAYPKKGARSEYGRWNGPFEMYKSSGFVECEMGKAKFVRKYL